MWMLSARIAFASVRAGPSMNVSWCWRPWNRSSSAAFTSGTMPRAICSFSSIVRVYCASMFSAIGS